MPSKAKKPCRYPGCPNLTDQTYCEAHRKTAQAEYNRHTRDPESNKMYGRSWRKVRDAYVKIHPICEDCEREGRIVPVYEVHHLIPKKRGGTDDFDNLISLCKSCHQKRDIELGMRSVF